MILHSNMKQSLDRLIPLRCMRVDATRFVHIAAVLVQSGPYCCFPAALCTVCRSRHGGTNVVETCVCTEVHEHQSIIVRTCARGGCCVVWRTCGNLRGDDGGCSCGVSVVCAVRSECLRVACNERLDGCGKFCASCLS